MRRFIPLIILLFIVIRINPAYGQGILVKPETDTGYFPVKSSNVIAIMGACETEVELLKTHLQDKHEQLVEGVRFYTGKLGDKQVVLTRSGIGKVNAALTTTLLLEHFRPKQVLFTGIAGAMNPSLHPGDIVIARLVAHHDYGRMTPEGLLKRGTRNPYHFAENPVYFPSDSILLAASLAASKKINLLAIDKYTPQITTGTIITGDVFMADTKMNASLRQQFAADAVEMEGAAVAQICYQQKVPFIIIHSLSDSANDSAALDFEKYGKTAAENSATLVLEIVRLLSK